MHGVANIMYGTVAVKSHFVLPRTRLLKIPPLEQRNTRMMTACLSVFPQTGGLCAFSFLFFSLIIGYEEFECLPVFA